MNYGKSNLSKRKKNISSKKKMKKKRVGVRFFKALVVSVLLLGVVCVIGAGIFAKKIIDNTPEVTAEDILPKGYTSTIYASDGTKLETLKDSDSNRVYKNYEDIPEYMAHAFVAIEDERFYEHNGIDLQGIARAAVVGITSGDFSEGASTLTQQLIKNNVFPNFTQEKTFFDSLERKLQEQYLALQIEKEMSKEEILEAYMNTINLGQGCLGVQTASMRYFNKDVSELTLSECTVIAAITQNPTRYDPVKNPDKNAKRREKVLDNMLEQGYISQAEHDEAKADKVYDRILETAAATTDSKPYSYFVDALINDIISDLIDEKGYTETQAYNLLYSGGLTINSTQDVTMQKICDEEVADVDDYLTKTEYSVSDYALTIHRADGTAENYSKQQFEKYIEENHDDKNPLVFSTEDKAQDAINEYKSTLNIDEDAGDTVDERIDIAPQPQASVVLMDQYTGQVKAIVGGRGEKKSSLSLNRATDSYRQPGSCFKILAAYAPAINEGNLTLASTIDDEPYEYKNGQKVNNWDNKYIGPTRVRYAIEHSMNVCAVKALTDDVGEVKSYDYLIDFGFTTLNDEDKASQAKALGGTNLGVYNIEMTAAYAAIANGGVYTEPILYTQVLDHDGNVLLDNSEPATHEVIKDSTAYLLTSAMEDVVTGSNGTGGAARMSDMPVAAKTGTAQESRDLWISAYTPYYTASVWGGYDEPKSMDGMSQNWHMKLWKNIMERIHEDLEYKDFEIPSSVEKKTICTESGLLATDSCPALSEYFAEDNVPTQSCSGHYTEPDPEEEEPQEGENPDGEGTDPNQTTDPNANPDQPATPDQPVTPDQPATPDQPTTPDPPADTGTGGNDQGTPPAQ